MRPPHLSRIRPAPATEVPSRQAPPSRRPLVCAVLLCGLSLALPAQVPMRIMPLGDSITESVTGRSSYRYWLWHSLVAAGYSVDFVGSMNGVYAGPPADSNFDLDHEGHTGWRADDILGNITSWTQAAQPDIVLMHLGTNDIYQGQGASNALGDLGSLVQQMRLVNPNVIVLVAQIIPGTTSYLPTQVPTLNTAIPALAASLSTPASPIISVDHFTGFDPSVDNYDGVHPAESGEKKMAERWLHALGPYLGSYRLVISKEQVSGDLLIRNLGAPANQRALSIFTFDTRNESNGFGQGWLSGLHIDLNEALGQFQAGNLPFLGPLDDHGALSSRIPAYYLVPFSGATLYAVAHSLDNNTMATAATSPVAFMIH